MWCIVNLPNGTQQAVKWDPKANGQECLEKVCKALGIFCEMEYFGLEHWSPNQQTSSTRQWINLRNRLSYDSGCNSNGIQLMLALRVKFWVPVHFILQENVRNLFYMQAKVDLLEGRLSARDWANGAKLAALLCQADGLRFNEMALRAECPMRIRREQQLLRQQQQQHQCHQQAQQHKDRKEKEHVLSFKKRRLSKQKSVEHIEQPQSSGQLSSSYGANGTLLGALGTHSYSLSAPTMARYRSSTTYTSAYAQASRSTSGASSSLAANSSSASTSPSNSSNYLTLSQPQLQQCSSSFDERLAASALRCYENYIILPESEYGTEPPEDFLRQIAVEHSKLAKLKMTPKSAKYWLLKEIPELSGYGEELFSGVTTNESATRCDIAVGAHGISVCRGEDKQSIPFSAIAAAKSLRRTFKLEYVDDHNDRKDLEIKLSKQPIAAGLYRSITERHAFYVCDKVRGVVTNQFTRDLKGTIASMFNEDTELGKRYVFDIQHTCREVHDQARRILHERGVELMTSSVDVGMPAVSDGAGIGAVAGDVSTCSRFGLDATCSGSMDDNIDLALREKEARDAAIERCVDTRISEAMTCKICMDRAIDTMFSPCCHVIACAHCAARCSNCPNCRVKVANVVKIYLPSELRTNTCPSGNHSGTDGGSASCSVGTTSENSGSSFGNITAADADDYNDGNTANDVAAIVSAVSAAPAEADGDVPNLTTAA